MNCPFRRNRVDDLEKEFNKRKPWITKFVINNKEYGGKYNAAADIRIKWFQEHFLYAENILELGCLEGGHSFVLARLPNIRRLVAIEGRKANIDRAKLVQSILKETKVDFIKANIEKFEFSKLGNFDVVFCVGLLYHLPKPWKLIEQMSKISNGMFLWTHYINPEKAKIVRMHYQGFVYREWKFIFDPLSGLSPASFWPTKASLLQMLNDYGFVHTTMLEDDTTHEHGPAITLVAKKLP